MKYGRQLQLAAFLLVLAVYIAARFWHLTESCLWFDEIFSVHAAEHPWNSILSFVSLDLIHPPLFYILLKLWIAIAGEGVFWLRFLPVSFAILAVYPYVSLCRELKLGRWTQILALFLFAVNGSVIKYAQEVRMYSLLMCLSLFSMWLFARYFIKGKSFVPLVIVNVLMVYTHYFGWFVVLSEVFLILWFQRIKWRRIVLMLGLAFVSFFPWFVAVWNAADAGSSLGQNIGWMSRPGPREIVTLVLNVIEPFYSQTSTAEVISMFRITVPLLMIMITATAIYGVSLFIPDHGDRRNSWFLLTFIKLPVIIALVASWLLPYSIWGTRHLIVVLPPLFILAAIVLSFRNVRWLPSVAVTLVVLFSAYGFAVKASYDVPLYSWCGFENAAQQANTENAGKLYVLEDLAAYHAWSVLKSSTLSKTQVVVVGGIPSIVEDKAYFLPRGFDEIRRAGIDEVNDADIWVMLRPSGSIDPLNAFFDRSYRIVSITRTKAAAGEEVVLAHLKKDG